jgi:hypothetical protein
VIEEALALGFRHFDVAPSYGFGLAENVLGEALAGVAGVTIATKVGIGRASNAGFKSLARQVLRPLLGAAPKLRSTLGRRVGSGGARGQFAPEQVEASLADSLIRLKRTQIDALLLHQPSTADLTPRLDATMRKVIAEGHALAVGAGTNDDACALVAFGTVSQHRFNAASEDLIEGSDLVLHGAIRRYPKPRVFSPMQVDGIRDLGRDPRDPAVWHGLVLTLALASRPGAILLISSTSPARLRSGVRAVDWSAVQAGPASTAALRRLVAA